MHSNNFFRQLIYFSSVSRNFTVIASIRANCISICSSWVLLSIIRWICQQRFQTLRSFLSQCGKLEDTGGQAVNKSEPILPIENASMFHPQATDLQHGSEMKTVCVCVFFLFFCSGAWQRKEQLPQSCSVLIRPPPSTLLKHYIQTAAKSYTTLPVELSQPVITLSPSFLSFPMGSVKQTHKHWSMHIICTHMSGYIVM